MKGKIKNFFEGLFWITIILGIILLVYFINQALIYFAELTIIGIPTTFPQLIAFLVFVLIGGLFFVGVLPLLDKFYMKSWTSLIATFFEFALYGAFLGLFFYVVYGLVFHENILIQMLMVAFLITMPISLHEFGHFIIAYLKGYKVLVLPFRFIENPPGHHNEETNEILAITIFDGKPIWLLSALGPLMNLILCILGIVFLLPLNLGFFSWTFIGYNVLLFLYNFKEITGS